MQGPGQPRPAAAAAGRSLPAGSRVPACRQLQVSFRSASGQLLTWGVRKNTQWLCILFKVTTWPGADLKLPAAFKKPAGRLPTSCRQAADKLPAASGQLRVSSRSAPGQLVPDLPSWGLVLCWLQSYPSRYAYEPLKKPTRRANRKGLRGLCELRGVLLLWSRLWIDSIFRTPTRRGGCS